MSDKELNSYRRFTPGAEPTDEMLSNIMKEVDQETKEKVHRQLMENIQLVVSNEK